MESKYFDKKLNTILGIMGLIILHRADETLVEKHKQDIVNILKEIAKDQRHACADAVYKDAPALEGKHLASIHLNILNTYMDKE